MTIFSDANNFPQIIFENVTRSVGAGRYLVIFAMLRVSDLVSMQKILCFEITECNYLIRIEIFALYVDLLKGFIKGLKLLLCHFGNRAKSY